MKEYYKGQKLYYRTGDKLEYCTVIGCKGSELYIQLRDGRKGTISKYTLNRTVFVSDVALILYEQKQRREKRKAEEQREKTIKKNKKEDEYWYGREEARANRDICGEREKTWRKRDKIRRLRKYNKKFYK